MFSLRDTYTWILFLEVILKFKYQSYKLQNKKKYMDFSLIWSNLLTPLSNQHFIYQKCIWIFWIALQTILSWKHTLWALIRLFPSANWPGSILSHTEWWYKRHRLKTNIEMKQTANDKSGNCWHVARRPHDHRAIALGLPQDDRPMSVRFYVPCKGIVWRPCGLITTIARVYDHFGVKPTI